MHRLLASLITSLLLVLSVSVPVLATERGDVAEMYRHQSPDDLIIDYMQRYNVPSIQVAIVQAPYIPRVVGFGLADEKTRRLSATNTLYALGEMTEAYTDVAIIQLVEQGKIKLADKISQYVPNLPQAWQAIELKTLLAHASGIPDYSLEKGFEPSKEYKPEDLIALVKEKHLLFRPNTSVGHSRTNFVLLGMVIEKASGMPYQSFVKKYQFEPLHLKTTFFVSDIGKIANEINDGPKPFTKHSKFKNKRIYINPTEMATGYIGFGGKNLEVKPFTASAFFANGSIAASAYDVSIWDVGLAGDILIKNKRNRAFLYNVIHLPNGQLVPAHGRWQFPGHKGLMYVKGFAPGYSAYLDRFTAPSELLCVTLVANKANLPDLAVLAREIGGAYQTDLQAPQGAKWITVRQSPYSVADTAKRIQQLIEKKGAKVFATINQAQQAKDAGTKLPPTMVIIFGNPAAGSPQMQAHPVLAMAMPMRVTIWQDKSGQVWVGYPDIEKLAKRMGVKPEDKTLQRMYVNVTKLMLAATTPY